MYGIMVIGIIVIFFAMIGYLLFKMNEVKKKLHVCSVSREMLKNTFECAEDIIILIDTGRKYHYLNNVIERISGLTIDYLTKQGMSSHYMVFIDDRSKVETAVESIFKKGTSLPDAFEFRITTLDNSLRWVSALFYPLKNKSGDCTHIGMIAREITKQKERENKLIKSEEEYRELFEKANDIICLLDAQGKIMSINKKAEEITQYSREELFSMNLTDLVTPDIVEDSIPYDSERLTAGKTKEFDTVIITKQGKPIAVEMRSKAILKDGKVFGIVGIIRDVSEKKAREEKLRISEEKLKKMFETVIDGIVLVDLNGCISDMNSAGLGIFGFKKQEVMGKDALSFVIREHAFRALRAFRITRKKGYIRNQTFLGFHKDGKQIPIELTISLMKDGKGNPTGYIAVIRDIREKVEQEQVLGEKMHELDQVNKNLKITQEQLIQSEKLSALGQLAGGVAHELNNPLTGILGNTQVVLSEIPPDSRWREDLIKIEECAQRCRTIVKNLLGFSRQQEYHFQLADINDAIEKTLDLYAHQLRLDNIQLLKNYHQELPPIPLSVPQIQQVFLNIIMNAHQAMPEGGTLTITTMQNEPEHGVKTIMIVFEDTGQGIKQEYLSHIFEPFFTTKDIGQGTGLGLSVSYGIVQKHKGSIRAENKDTGARFVIELPIE